MYNEIVLKIKARENVKMRIIIFGTGKISMRFLSKLKKDIEIAAFLDNDPSKWERRIEQIPVLPPQKALELDYDFIFFMIFLLFDFFLVNFFMATSFFFFFFFFF